MKIITSGESHGPAMSVIIDGFPSGVVIDTAMINDTLAQRMGGVGRGKRMQIEQDTITILSGIRAGITIGSPITLLVENKDHKNWQGIMNPEGTIRDDYKPRQSPRPGHADFAGSIKYNHEDIRNVLERASARSSVSYVLAGSMAQQLLAQVGISVEHTITHIGEHDFGTMPTADYHALIESVKQAKNTIGGRIQICANNVPAGIGSYSQWEDKLDAKIAASIMSIPTTKAVEIGCGTDARNKFGSDLHDQLYYNQEQGIYRQTNNAGGIEGGMSNGEQIVVAATSKPIPTLMQPLASVHLQTMETTSAFVERSDVSVLEAYGIIAENMLALTLAQMICQQCGSDTIDQVQDAIRRLRKQSKGGHE